MKNKIKFLYIVFFTFILYTAFMLTWEFVPKSQTDPETIEEAITRIIGDHNDDPEAHLSEGASLSAHRENPIIDHPQGSIMADKESFKEQIVQMPFESIDGYQKTGEVYNPQHSLQLYTGGGAVQKSALQTSFNLFANWNLFAADFYYQCIGRYIFEDNDYTSYFGFTVGGSITDVTPSQFVGFYITAGNMQAMVKKGSTVETVNLTGVVLSQGNIYRVIYTKAEDIFRFYVNGDLVAEIDDFTGDEGSGVTYIRFYMDNIDYPGDDYEYEAYFGSATVGLSRPV